MQPPPKRQNIETEVTPSVQETLFEFHQSQFAPRDVSLPLDVLLLILDAVHDLKPPSDALKTLCLCARSCRVMLRPSQVRLYAKVTISRRSEFERFGRTLLDNPKLAALVKTLYTDVGSAYSDVSLLPTDGPLSYTAIRGMTNLQMLTVGGMRKNKLLPSMRRDSPVLEAFIGSFAVSCLQLTFLRLRKVHFGEYTGLVRQVTSFPVLERLKLSASTWGKPGQLTLNEIISTVSRHRLSAFWMLEHLELHLMNDDIRGVVVALRHITSKDMKTICVHHRCRGISEYMPMLYANLGLDEILAGPIYRSLTRVTWRLVSNQGEAQVWLAGLPRCFARLAKRKILVCEWRFEPMYAVCCIV
ncbi:hypothetical protein K466DRAFT_654265 [Polyporus arcularius HHB13444]|uniref:F-box domain-containing protein n=1 Tax=Polyporus arcularius HHB13444 TaxID=1314778 RepID=A0A5C3P6X3_9APHY|nr:hypothetical protein K466DRAFT_654265 [Polyporus arcularius HHB13444]